MFAIDRLCVCVEYLYASSKSSALYHDLLLVGLEMCKSIKGYLYCGHQPREYRPIGPYRLAISDRRVECCA